MFYIERSITGPCLCSDIHDCMCVASDGKITWTRDGSQARAFRTKEEAEEYCRSHGFSLEPVAHECDPRYIIVEEIRLPEVRCIADKYGILFDDAEHFISWGASDYCIQIVRNTDVSTFPFTCSQKYVYVVGARLIQKVHGHPVSQNVIEEIHTPSYKQLDEFVAKCVREHSLSKCYSGGEKSTGCHR